MKREFRHSPRHLNKVELGLSTTEAEVLCDPSATLSSAHPQSATPVKYHRGSNTNLLIAARQLRP
jgi:hypothetical protein